MTPYAADDLANDWEFKIVRANTQAFRNPRRFQTLLQQEAQAGWTMVEKFDDMRVRFKRPRQARQNDAQLPSGVDPYRTYYGMSPNAYGAVAVVLALALAAAIVGITLLAVQ